MILIVFDQKLKFELKFKIAFLTYFKYSIDPV